MAREYKEPEPLKDDDIIPSGKYAKGGIEGGATGVRMIDVPAKYLLYIYDNQMCSDRVKQYVEDNVDVLRKEAM